MKKNLKKKIKKFLHDSAWRIFAILIIAMWLFFFYMVFGSAWETAQFHMVMRTIAG